MKVVCCLCPGAVFFVTFALLGLNLWGAAVVIGVVVMILVHMLGVMALLDINANAVSLVNLVMVSMTLPFPISWVKLLVFLCRQWEFLCSSVLTSFAGSLCVTNQPGCNVPVLPLPIRAAW